MYEKAWNLAIGIGIQNFPEGFAVSVPLYREGMSKWHAFLAGQASGMVEPIAGLLGYFMVSLVQVGWSTAGCAFHSPYILIHTCPVVRRHYSHTHWLSRLGQ